MKRKYMELFAQWEGKAIGHITNMSYRYSQYCVKADPMALLPIYITDDVTGVEEPLEKCAYVFLYDTPEDRDKYDLVPKETRFFEPIVRVALETHPEFKISLEKIDDVEDDDGALENMKIRLAVPPVNKDRRDLIVDQINMLRDLFKARVDGVAVEYTAKITLKMADAAPDEVQEIEKGMEDAKKRYSDLFDQMTKSKLDEVEEAYQRFVTNKERAGDIAGDGKEISREEEDNPQKAGQSLKIF